MNRLSRSALAGLLMLLPSFAPAEEKKDPGPVITAIAPLEVVLGTKVTLHIRGLRLDTATEVSFVDAPAKIAVALKEKKKTEVPNGLEAKDIGDTEATVELTMPSELTAGTLTFRVITADGPTATHSLRVAAAADLIDEKEPNNGFHQAQELPLEKTLRGAIGQEKDVDVFRFEGKAKQVFCAEVRAARLGSLLDAVMTLFDAQGHLLATCDDANGSRDPQLSFTLLVDGQYYLSIQDAQDRGGSWHCYELEAKETAP